MDKKEILATLVSMSRELAEPANDYVILGEGNTSAKLDDASFAVKASGTSLHNIQPEHFVEVSFQKVLAALELPSADDSDVKDILQKACVDPLCAMRPSVETIMHAALLQLPGINFVGHTHPTAVNQILCSKNWKEVLQARIFPDEVVSCGLAPVLVEYTDPGLPLAKVVSARAKAFLEATGEPPKAVLMQNHGPFTVGPDATVGEVLHQMATNRIGCVMIVDGGRPVGIFSERDALMKLNTEAASLSDRPISEFMTANPETLQDSAKIAFAVQRMDVGGYRHLPIVSRDDQLQGIISVRAILNYLTDRMTSAS